MPKNVLKLGLCQAVAAFMCIFPISTAEAASDNSDGAGDYQSPYSVKFSIPEEQLLAPDNEAPRNNPRMESDTPFDQWQSARVHRKYGKWGPGQRRFPGLNNNNSLSPEWKRERIIAVAIKYTGLAYQHHHIPAFKTSEGKRGLDCSNFTSWVYNYGLGIKINSDVHKQADQAIVQGPGAEEAIAITSISNDGGYNDLVKKLKPADLLYIRNKSGVVSHVIIWVGDLGVSPDHTPLIIDSTGPEHRDCQGTQIPGGIHLRPFKKNSWYYKSFDHAHRIIN